MRQRVLQAAQGVAGFIGRAWPLCLRTHLALFYLLGAYHHLAHRWTGIRYVSVAARPYRNFSYRPLGALLLVQLIGEVVANVLRHRRLRSELSQIGKSARVENRTGACRNTQSKNTSVLGTPDTLVDSAWTRFKHPYRKMHEKLGQDECGNRFSCRSAC